MPGLLDPVNPESGAPVAVRLLTPVVYCPPKYTLPALSTAIASADCLVPSTFVLNALLATSVFEYLPNQKLEAPPPR